MEAFDDGVVVRSPRRDPHLVDARDGETSAEPGSSALGTVAAQHGSHRDTETPELFHEPIDEADPVAGGDRSGPGDP